VLRLSLFFMVGLTIAIAVGLRWREERVAQVKPPTRGARLGWIAMQKQKVHRWFTAAALAAVVATPTARIGVDTSALQSSKSVFLSGAGSGAPLDRSITGYQWTQLSGQEVGAFVGTTTSAQATVVFVGTTGSVEVQLRVTDNTGASDTARQVLFAGTAPAAPAPSGGGGGGGGSANAAWTLALLLACGWLWRQRALALRGAL